MMRPNDDALYRTINDRLDNFNKMITQYGEKVRTLNTKYLECLNKPNNSTLIGEEYVHKSQLDQSIQEYNNKKQEMEKEIDELKEENKKLKLREAKESH